MSRTGNSGSWSGISTFWGGCKSCSIGSFIGVVSELYDWFLLFLWSIWFVWLNYTYQLNETNQINQINLPAC
jgi:hypothetical protein